MRSVWFGATSCPRAVAPRYASPANNSFNSLILRNPAGLSSTRVKGVHSREVIKMFKKILIPTDGSALSEGAAKQALQLAKSVNASVVAFHCRQPFHVFAMGTEMLTDTREVYERDINARSMLYLARIEDLARSAGVPCETTSAESDHAWESIIGAAESAGCDLIAMASHGRRGVTGLLLGSQAQHVLTHSKIPTLVLR
jgi:nucleotide-binding universal stress UspA family protein